jgi:hypothetical protein
MDPVAGPAGRALATLSAPLACVSITAPFVADVSAARRMGDDFGASSVVATAARSREFGGRAKARLRSSALPPLVKLLVMHTIVEAATAALRAGFMSVPAPLDDAKRDVLCGYVHVFVDVVLELGWPPERAIIAVKAIAKDAGFETTPRRTLDDIDGPRPGEDVLIDAVGWCVRRYFRFDSTKPSDFSNNTRAEFRDT